MGRSTTGGLALVLFLSLGARAPGIGTAFLTIPVSPRELALGGATSSIVGDPSLSRGNPALIVQTIPSTEFYVGYNAWFSGTQGTSVLVVQPAFGGTGGLAIRNLGIADLQLRTERPEDDYLALFAASGSAIEGIWGRRFDRLRVGAALRWIRMELDIHTSSGFGADLGLWWPLVRNRISVGASVQNLGSMDKLLAEAPSLPTTFQAGVTYRVTSERGSGRRQFQSFVTAGMERSDLHGLVTRVAGEVSFENLLITLGMRRSERVTGVAGSVSLNWRRFRVAYGLAIESHQLGIPHLFQIKTTLP